MGVIEEIQADLVSGSASIGNVLLKLRLLAAKLGSDELAAWIKYEAEGYSTDAEIPDYRELGMSFSGTFSGPFGSGVQNAPIPPILIGKIAGKSWVTHKLRYSAAAVESLAKDDKGISLDLSNLMVVLRGKIYPDYEPVQIKGYISQPSIIEVANAIRNRLLEIAIEIEKRIPEASGVNLNAIAKKPEIATQILNQTVYGNVTAISNSGEHVNIGVAVQAGNVESVRDFLLKAGMNNGEANELANAIAQEKPNTEVGLGKKALKWIGERITNGADVGIKGGLAALTNLAQEAAMKYWELK